MNESDNMNIQLPPPWDNEQLRIPIGGDQHRELPFQSFLELMTSRKRLGMGPFNPQEHEGTVREAKNAAAAKIRKGLQADTDLQIGVGREITKLLSEKLTLRQEEMALPHCDEWARDETLAEFAGRTFNLALAGTQNANQQEIIEFWQHAKTSIDKEFGIDLDKVARQATDQACLVRIPDLPPEQWLDLRALDDTTSEWEQRIASWEETLRISSEKFGNPLTSERIREVIKFLLETVALSGETQDLFQLFKHTKEAVIQDKPITSMVLVCLRWHQTATEPFFEVIPDLEPHSFADGMQASDERPNIDSFLNIARVAHAHNVPMRTTILVSDIDFLTTEHSTTRDPRFEDAIQFQHAITEFVETKAHNDRIPIEVVRITEVLNALDWNTTFFEELNIVLDHFWGTLRTHQSGQRAPLIRSLHQDTLIRFVDDQKVKLLKRPDKIWLRMSDTNENKAIELQALLSLARDIVISRMFSRLFDVFILPSHNMHIPPGFNFGRIFTKQKTTHFPHEFREGRELINIAIPSQRIKIKNSQS